jgi:transcriptional regulator with XRE-family HTH domain
MTLGNKIQELRVSRGMSQEQFGEMFDTTRQTVSKWELDQAIPDIRKIVAMSRVFCVPTDDFLLNVSTFERDGVPFPCGVYRSRNFEIVETEKLCLEYYSDKADGRSIMGAKVYEGNGDKKEMTAIVEKDFYKGTIFYAYRYEDEVGARKFVGNNDDLSARLGEGLDRSRFEKAECLESFLVNHGEYSRHTVSEAGIKKCLEEWRLGACVGASGEHFYLRLITGKSEHIFSIRIEASDIYCGCSFNMPFELGLRSYGQYFRLRNYKDNSETYCNSFYDWDYRMPSEESEVDFIKLGDYSQKNGFLTWFVKRYKDDEIVLAGCNGEEYRFSKNDKMFEIYT